VERFGDDIILARGYKTPGSIKLTTILLEATLWLLVIVLVPGSITGLVCCLRTAAG
jgi:hypothetical protein